MFLFRTKSEKQRLRDEFASDDPFTLVNATHLSRVTVDGKGSTSAGKDASSQHVDSSTTRRQFQMLKLFQLLPPSGQLQHGREAVGGYIAAADGDP